MTLLNGDAVNTSLSASGFCLIVFQAYSCDLFTAVVQWFKAEALVHTTVGNYEGYKMICLLHCFCQLDVAKLGNDHERNGQNAYYMQL